MFKFATNKCITYVYIITDAAWVLQLVMYRITNEK